MHSSKCKLLGQHPSCNAERVGPSIQRMSHTQVGIKGEKEERDLFLSGACLLRTRRPLNQISQFARISHFGWFCFGCVCVCVFGIITIYTVCDLIFQSCHFAIRNRVFRVYDIREVNEHD
ncbi:hypothetical protein BU24DRAFT_232906 [Aaosphaeria arxii CBS 175.79]|uniref:Uncharacterized protein n=1 Tax=Aaosphaeria arxii CBS 175.79 TaxID=1450172 RepID=A0A6A5XK70_9PLEO|nr:uncharacterized protein BU24DRAFT_232906 [Aaosphaeria arxii CBS 175.79]KAF2013241.1 hypothetical protein BU24DRAFT_232906 [Aaosphaeria arxii CBS 175.79]